MSMRPRQWISSTAERPWTEESCDPVPPRGPRGELAITDTADQAIEGFGGCFNELGMVALDKLSGTDRDRVLDALFDPGESGFTLFRLPIGASDYATRWYSYDEHEGDLSLEKFSIDPDRRWLLPYIRAARTRQSGMRFFASPWSPPTWMKLPAVYNFGRLRMEEPILGAYARYFVKYLRAYEAEGITVGQVHIQNEPFADQKFPSCRWSADQYLVFIRDYLGPLFEKEHIDAEIWFGTLNGPEAMKLLPSGEIILDPYHEYVEKVLLDQGARRYIRGVGYQWAGRQNVGRTHAAFPELRLMQTESECGDGGNTWEYAFYVFDLIRHYLAEGAGAYIYWNMALEAGGESSWGWRQNSMVTIAPDGSAAGFNPEYHIMRHFSRFARAGARRLVTKGVWTASAVAFRNLDGTLAVVAANFQDAERTIAVSGAGKEEVTLTLRPRSINSIAL
jgi:glucosylceramidase